MSTVSELVENFCWKSKTRSVWKDEPDLLDNAMARIHSEAAVTDAILRSKNTTVPSLEKISKTVKFLEQNSFWRSNPFSLVSGAEDDPAVARATRRLQMKCIRDLWESSACSGITSDDSSVAFVQRQAEFSTEIRDFEAIKLKVPRTAELTTVETVFRESSSRHMPVLSPKSVNSKEKKVTNSSSVICDRNDALQTYAEAARCHSQY
ncbi:hypothetical protein CRM22_002514 [Opisthorchis felineus]|uniref:Uncharacterized protein n=1 Tax=Opisthorchis felineus TaxID=147828 RepID=A0A4S2M5M6_OPIFE|nr:hypothetical protein CRM22_002514 [Opisthorchis felineus]